ncbi:hypothetical protein [Aporhodopirellula aestuarii]|uniref:Uncharacterized protein n=1 Tax=Aporhodopirellula aestuarii TaxID=2950107 RepID=A0ABT0U1M8_9BACT|nr:hypothetical protein [Aporhodopirellula aestuarii]MCM2370783.1 hypothetical protein [Aporhodopirellula aestuarii]
MISSGDSYCVASRIRDRFDLARFIELIEVTVRTARPHPSTASDTTGRNLDKVNRISGPTDPNHCPLVTELVEVSTPQNLCRSVRLRLQRVTSRFANVRELMPSFYDVDSRGHDAIEHHAADLVFRDRFDGDPNATCMFAFGRAHALDCCIANESGQFHRAECRIGQRRLEADDSANRNRGCRQVVNANGCGVSQMRARTTSARQSISMRGFGSDKQSVVFSSGDRKLIAWFNASGH